MCLLVFLHSHASCGTQTTLQSRADDVVALFSADPGHYDQTFAPSFLDAVPAEQLTLILRQTYKEVGRCTSAKLLKSASAEAGEFDFQFEKGFASHVSLAIDAAPPHLVTGFFIGPPVPTAKSIDDVIAQLKTLPGAASLFVANVKPVGLEPIAQLNADTPMAIGSSFKLYVLAELIREISAGERKWDDVIALDDSARSLPSGFLCSWPTGSPLTLHTLASLMISQSDNTAADELIHVIGRDKIEKLLPTLGMKQPQRNIPFLTTLEMFKLKSDASGKLMEDYLAGDAADRLKLLNGRVAAMSRDAVQPYAKPTHIADVEWFASTSDLARAMRWLRDATAEQAGGTPAAAREILAINPGLPISKAAWPYIGFKGGSEPGVLNLTYLLQARDGHWVTLSATWNDPDHVVDETRFFGLVERVIELAK